MENSMIEHSIGLKVIATTIGKPLMWLAIALGFYPAFDFVILQVDHTVFLTPYWRELLDEIKVVLGVLISVFVLIKLIIGVAKLIKEKK